METRLGAFRFAVKGTTAKIGVLTKNRPPLKNSLMS